MSKYYADDDPNNPEHPDFDPAWHVGQRKATPKLRYLVSISVRGERAKEFGAIYGEVLSWFGCHNTDWRASEVRVHIEDAIPYDNRLEIELILDARMEDLDPACEHYATKDVEIVIFENDDGMPGPKLMHFNEQGTRY